MTPDMYVEILKNGPTRATAVCMAIQFMQFIEGDINGDLRLSLAGNPYMAYEGIRYGADPGDIHKFEKTMPSEVNGNLQKKVNCLDVMPRNGELFGVEDCLFLNVYSPLPFKNKSMPVLVWIHGSGFRFGASQISKYEPKGLMDNDLVVVTISYRVGPLGFASLENVSFPGNYGLMDQETAIKWVLNNIHKFGGNRKKVTLAGHGLGAAHALVHLNGDLGWAINRGIALSGSRFADWAAYRRHEIRARSKKLAESLDCKLNILKCLREAAATQIVYSAHEMFDSSSWWHNLKASFTPVVDSHLVQNDIWYFPGSWKHFPLLFGFTRNEGAIMQPYSRMNGLYWPMETVNWVYNVTSDSGKLYEEIAPSNPRGDPSAFKDLFDLYNKTENRLDLISKVTTDAWFLAPAMVEASWHSGPITAFMFNYTSGLGHAECTESRKTGDVLHGDDIPFLFSLDGCKLNRDRQRMAEKYSGMIADFVHERDLGLKNSSADPELFDVTKALKDPTRFAEFDEELAKRMELWKKFLIR